MFIVFYKLVVLYKFFSGTNIIFTFNSDYCKKYIFDLNVWFFMDFVFLRDIKASTFLEGNVSEKKFELGTRDFYV